MEKIRKPSIQLITVCIRVNNLKKIAKSILSANANNYFEILWSIRFDLKKDQVPEKVLNELRTFPININIEYKSHPINKTTGGNHGKRELIRSAARKTWVYQLDDDNLLHPKLLPTLYKMMRKHPDSPLFVFWQAPRYQPKTLAEIKLGFCDTAMHVFRSDLAKGVYFPLNFAADGIFLEGLVRKAGDSAILIPKNLCYYNAIGHKKGDIPPITTKIFGRPIEHQGSHLDYKKKSLRKKQS